MPDWVCRYACVGLAAMLLSVAGNMLLMQPSDVRVLTDPSRSTGSGRLSRIDSASDVANGPRRTATEAERAAAEKRGLWRSVQTALARQGYDPGGETDVVSLQARAAILAYEYDHALPLTANASQDLLQALIFGLPRRPGKGSLTTGPAARELVERVQTDLNRLGFAAGTADGKYGPSTRRAVAAFERRHGLHVTGRVSGRLIQALATASGRRDVSLAQHNQR